MKKLLILVILFLLPALVFAEESVRTWTTVSGKTMSAVWMMDSDLGEGKIRLRSGNRFFRIRLEQLSEADQKYVKEKLAAGNSRNTSSETGETSGNASDSGDASVEKSRRRALLIGVNAYNKPIRSLNFCVNDMNYLAQTFEMIGFQKENITLMTDDSKPSLRPTLVNIKQQIEKHCREAEAEDLLVIAFSGHGVMVDQKAYLCPGDTNAQKKDSLISRDWVYEQMENSRAAQKLMIVDACRNEITIPGAKAFGDAKPLNPDDGVRKGFILLASCQPNQYSWEIPELQHGVFTHFLIEGLRGGAKNEEGYISIIALADYASRKTKGYVHRHIKTHQVPMVQMPNEMTNFFIAKLESSLELLPQPEESYSDSDFSLPPVLPGKKAGERMVREIDGVEYAFRWCPPGTFMMGSPENEPDREIDEELHEVQLTKGFWMLETEVTIDMWLNMMGRSQIDSLLSLTQRDKIRGVISFYHGARQLGQEIHMGRTENFNLGGPEVIENIDIFTEFPNLPNEKREDIISEYPEILMLYMGNEEFEQVINSRNIKKYPVRNVSVEECQDFCRKLSSKLGCTAALPTEAQWEYACRAGSNFLYSSYLDSMGWYGEDESSGCTHPVGLKRANAWGLYDMHGNVGEWCADVYNRYTINSPTIDPQYPGDEWQNNRIYRGGCWFNEAKHCRSAFRGQMREYSESNLCEIGFRVILTVKQ